MSVHENDVLYSGKDLNQVSDISMCHILNVFGIVPLCSFLGVTDMTFASMRFGFEQLS